MDKEHQDLVDKHLHEVKQSANSNQRLSTAEAIGGAIISSIALIGFFWIVGKMIDKAGINK